MYMVHCSQSTCSSCWMSMLKLHLYLYCCRFAYRFSRLHLHLYMMFIGYNVLCWFCDVCFRLFLHNRFMKKLSRYYVTCAETVTCSMLVCHSAVQTNKNRWKKEAGIVTGQCLRIDFLILKNIMLYELSSEQDIKYITNKNILRRKKTQCFPIFALV